MGKTISTFLCYFLISFIISFFPEAFHLRVKKYVHNSVVPADGAHTKVEFLNACIPHMSSQHLVTRWLLFYLIRVALLLP